jgi:mono/diheme cytochrome c family protein
VRPFSSVSSLLFINTDVVKPNEIRSAKDLLNPKWRGKISAEDITTTGAGANLAARFYQQLGPDFVKKLYIDQKTVGTRERRQFTDWLARGTQPIVPREQRDVAAKIPNPVKPTRESIALGKERFDVLCTPCHGPEAKGGVTGPVATKFIPPPDLTNAELHRQRTDGYWHSYIMVGGAVMPAYGEALSSQEAWHVVNYLRSLGPATPARTAKP